jgi:hypothetical protein
MKKHCLRFRAALGLVFIIFGFSLFAERFVSGSAFADPMIQGVAKMGGMFSLVAALLGILLGKVVHIRKVR